MKNLLFLLTFIFCACQKSQHPIISMPVDKYKLLSKNSEDLVWIASAYKKSKVDFVMDFKTGEFSGKYKEINYKGAFDIKKISSGFAKGFNYRVELAYMSKDETTEKHAEAFFQSIINCNRIFVSPDRLVDSQYVKMEFSGEDESEKLIMYLLK